jgi:hypothetical protein
VISDPARRVSAVERRDVIAGQDPPVADAGVCRGPALNAGKQAFDARAVEGNAERHAVNRPHQDLPAAGRVQHGHQVFSAGQDENI